MGRKIDGKGQFLPFLKDDWIPGGEDQLSMDRESEELEKGLRSDLSISLEELVRIGEDPSLSSPMHVTPRLSIATTAITDDFARTLYKINANLKEMRRMSGKLGGPDDSHEHRAKLNALTEVTKDMIMKANFDLKQLGQKRELANGDRLRLTRMTREFQLLMEEFQEIQKVSLGKCQDFVARAQAIARDSSQASLIETNTKDDSPDQTKDTSPLMRPQSATQTQDIFRIENEISYNQALIQEREQGIQEIEAAMVEVHEIFCDLGLLVGEQQGLIDNIEANMEASAVRTRAAVRELVVARDRQRRRRGNICCMLFFAIFVLIMTVAIINAIF